MMNKGPKKIWMGDNAFAWAMEDDIFNIPYIREDLVLGLVEALNECLKVEGYKNARDMIEAALKKLEEE